MYISNRTTLRVQRFIGWLTVTLLLISCGAAPKASPQEAQPEETTASSEPIVPEKAAPPRYEVTDTVVIKTNLGSMTFELYGKAAPKTVSNFLDYVDSGFFEGKLFHRIIDGFMIQGGGFDESLTRGETNPPIRLELIPSLKHTSGVLSMARQPSDIHSATSQFFVCLADAPQLNGGYAAFGKLTEGEETLYAISRVATHSVETSYGQMNDVPITPVMIESVTRL